MRTDYSAGLAAAGSQPEINGAGRDAGERGSPESWSRARRRSVPHLLLGVLLVLACTVASLVLQMRSSERESVLAVVRPVTVGQLLAPEDLTQVEIAADPAVRTVSAAQAAGVVGRPMSTSLPAGALLTPEVLGPVTVPPVGQGIVALELKSVPAGVFAGATVSVVLSSPQPGAGQPAGRVPGQRATWPAVVTAVTSIPDQQATGVSVQLSAADAVEVAAAPAGQLSLVLLGRGER